MKQQLLLILHIVLRLPVFILGPYWSWSYGSWSYNYLYNQCLSPLTLWVRIPPGEMYSIQQYVIKFVGDLRQVVFSKYSGFLHQWNWPPRYNWNIVESCVKYHNPHPYYLFKKLETFWNIMRCCQNYWNKPVGQMETRSVSALGVHVLNGVCVFVILCSPINENSTFSWRWWDDPLSII